MWKSIWRRNVESKLSRLEEKVSCLERRVGKAELFRDYCQTYDQSAYLGNGIYKVKDTYEEITMREAVRAILTHLKIKLTVNHPRNRKIEAVPEEEVKNDIQV